MVIGRGMLCWWRSMALVLVSMGQWMCSGTVGRLVRAVCAVVFTTAAMVSVDSCVGFLSCGL